jgi:hypothetical protein
MLGRSKLNEALEALAAQLAAKGKRRELVVIGGSGLIALGLIERPTRDVDVVALASEHGLEPADPLPDDLTEAAHRVAADLDLEEKWLNAEPSRDLLELGLPEGFQARLRTQVLGPILTVHFADRLDQVHLKLYAVVDQGPGRHLDDLQALKASRDELIAAARWARTHDPSEGFRAELLRVLAYLGVTDADV